MALHISAVLTLAVSMPGGILASGGRIGGADNQSVVDDAVWGLAKNQYRMLGCVGMGLRVVFGILAGGHAL